MSGRYYRRRGVPTVYFSNYTGRSSARDDGYSEAGTRVGVSTKDRSGEWSIESVCHSVGEFEDELELTLSPETGFPSQDIEGLNRLVLFDPRRLSRTQKGFLTLCGVRRSV